MRIVMFERLISINTHVHVHITSVLSLKVRERLHIHPYPATYVGHSISLILQNNHWHQAFVMLTHELCELCIMSAIILILFMGKVATFGNVVHIHASETC